MKRKNLKIAILTFINKKCYQVVINKNESQYIIDLLVQMQPDGLKISMKHSN